MNPTTDKSQEFFIEIHNSENLEELLDLIKTNYNSSDIINRKYLNWQYKANPVGRPVMEVARQSNSNDLVGQYLVIPLGYVKDGNLVKGSLSLNTLTREDFRGKGLFTKLATATYNSCLTQGITFTIGFPNPNSYGGFVKKLGFKNPGELQFLIKPLSYLGIVVDKIKNRKLNERHGDDLPMKKFEQIELGEPFKIEELLLENGTNEYADFWNRVSKGYHFTTDRNHEYIKWRYIDLPTRKYKLLKITENNFIKGILVLRNKQVYGLNVGIIVDFFGERGNRQLDLYYRKSLKAVLKYFRAQRLSLAMTVITPESEESNHLKALGFFAPPKKILPQQFPFIIRNHKNPERDVADFHKSHFMFGDYDVI
jgi:hypothetical protein